MSEYCDEHRTRAAGACGGQRTTLRRLRAMDAGVVMMADAACGLLPVVPGALCRASKPWLTGWQEQQEQYGAGTDPAN